MVQGQSWPKISIVTPSYKSAALIEQTIQSVLSQNYPNLEYIVIDGAGDDTVQILQRYSEQLAYWCSEPDKGQYDALNKGLSKATGDVLCWLNADDMLLPRALFLVGEVFREFADVHWVSSLRPGSWDANGYLTGLGSVPGFSKKAFLDGCFLPGTRKVGHWIQQESTFFSRKLWEKAGSKIPNCHLAGDFLLWCEFYRHTELYGIDYPLSGFRRLAGQRSEALDAYRSEASQGLAVLRRDNNWSGSILKKLMYASPMRVFHGRAKNVLASKSGFLGYAAKRICGVNPGVECSGLKMQDYRFLP